LGKLTALRADIAAKYGAPVYLKRYWSQNFWEWGKYTLSLNNRLSINSRQMWIINKWYNSKDYHKPSTQQRPVIFHTSKN
jgi:hypothetical protein